MSRIKPPRPAKLICGLIGSDPDLLARARGLLAKQIRQIEAVSDIWPFDFTDYYKDEMGPNLKRQFVSFEGLMQVDRLAGDQTPHQRDRAADRRRGPGPGDCQAGQPRSPVTSHSRSLSWRPPRTTRTGSTCRRASTPNRLCTTRQAGGTPGRGLTRTTPGRPTTASSRKSERL